ncbi:MAG: glycosyltransferase family 2 protein [Candidatus Pristimantibacillus sp.]
MSRTRKSTGNQRGKSKRNSHSRIRRRSSMKEGERLTSAWRQGRKAAEESPWQEGIDNQLHLQKLWIAYYNRSGTSISANKYAPIMKSFIEGYCSKLGISPNNWVLLPTKKTVAAVVMAMNEEDSIASTLRQLERMPLNEIIVIINGSTDDSLGKARGSSKAVLLHYDKPLGHDVGRAVGAKVTVSDIVLFVDADIPLVAEQLISFIRRTELGMDVALNDLSPFIGKFMNRDEVTIVKEFLNRSVDRQDLSINSLTAVPHALSRMAIQLIGPANLAVPPKAQAIALLAGLRVGVGGSVDVISRNRIRKSNSGAGNQMARLIVGDHLEALDWVMKAQHPRLKFKDLSRVREQMA